MINLLHYKKKDYGIFHYGITKNFDGKAVYDECLQTLASAKTHQYDSSIEKKAVSNNADYFGPNTLKICDYMISNEFTSSIAKIFFKKELADRIVSDRTLHGGGIHCHENGQYLNPHLDYQIHPKLNPSNPIEGDRYFRVLNAILYVNPDWQSSWGGNLRFWDGTDEMYDKNQELESLQIDGGDLVIFQTQSMKGSINTDVKNVWHGVEPLNVPEHQPDMKRMSLAFFYLLPVTNQEASGCRTRAKFAPRQDQLNDSSVIADIKNR